MKEDVQRRRQKLECSYMETLSHNDILDVILGIDSWLKELSAAVVPKLSVDKISGINTLVPVTRLL